MNQDIKQVISIVDHVIGEVKEQMNRMFACTMPLYRVAEEVENSDTVSTDRIGCGVLLRYCGRTFVVTAHHVVDDCGGPGHVFYRQTVVDGSPKVMSFGGLYRWPAANPGLDIGMFEFDLGQLGNTRFVPFDVSDRDDDYAYPGGSFFVVGGFPASAIKKQSNRGPFRIFFKTIITLESELDVVSHAPDLHIVLKYDLKNQAKYMAGESGTQKGVLPKGMSGCGIYRISLLPNPDGEHVVHMVGILTEYDKKRRLLIGTRLKPLLRTGFLQNV